MAVWDLLLCVSFRPTQWTSSLQAVSFTMSSLRATILLANPYSGRPTSSWAPATLTASTQTNTVSRWSRWQHLPTHCLSGLRKCWIIQSWQSWEHPWALRHWPGEGTLWRLLIRGPYWYGGGPVFYTLDSVVWGPWLQDIVWPAGIDRLSLLCWLDTMHTSFWLEICYSILDQSTPVWKD